MANILIVYGSKQGQSAKIADTLAEELDAGGHQVDVFNARDVPDWVKLEEYDGFIGGGGVHMFRYPRAFSNWVRRNSKPLATIPSAFYSVCLGILSVKDPKAQADEKKIVQDFFSWSGWSPQRWTIFAGALPYSKYNWITKRVMRRIAASEGTDTDTSRDYEYTNWDEVRQFAREFSTRLAGAA